MLTYLSGLDSGHIDDALHFDPAVTGFLDWNEIPLHISVADPLI